MKKYTIKEFAEGKKAVKIENEEQWNKLNKVHKLCTLSSCKIGYYFNNAHEWCEKDWYVRNGWEVLEFSQLDFEDDKEKTMEKEVIGYKLVKQEYKEVAMKITNCSDEIVWDNNLKSYGYLFSQGSVHSDKLKEAGVLDLWFEPVYASQIQLPTIDGYRGYYEKGIIKYGCAKFSKMFFEHLNSTNSHLGNRTIKSIKLSSDVEISIEEIKQIVEYINKK